jgi:Putative MetA-pathway of phenol degradation
MRWFVSRGLLAVAATCCLDVICAFAEEKDARPAATIQDNSFLIEEAYNQEPGVVQHISTLRRIAGRDWHFNFTQEWPLGSQDNQFSYSVPYSWIRNDEDQRVHGFGHSFLNYRRQVWHEGDTIPAFAPRLSLIVPTGSKSVAPGDGSYGFEANLPFSKIVSDRVRLHANAGLNHFFDVHGRSPTSYRLGGSAIYAVTRNFNWMLEAVGEWEQSVDETREIARKFVFTANPGFRYAVNFRDDSQLVMGFSIPVGLTREVRRTMAYSSTFRMSTTFCRGRNSARSTSACKTVNTAAVSSYCHVGSLTSPAVNVVFKPSVVVWLICPFLTSLRRRSGIVQRRSSVVRLPAWRRPTFA